MRILMLTIFMFSSFIFAQNDSVQKNELSKKLYVQANQISLTENGIFVCINNQWLETPSLHSDSFGIYVDSIKILPWICPSCGLWTNGWFCCEHCGCPAP